MRKIKVISVLLCTLMLIGGCGTKDSDTDAYIQEQDEIMDQMMDDMEIKETGNASLDFLKGMIPHHKSAIEMSKSYLKYAGEKAEFSELANTIINAQEEEIGQMEDMTARLEKSGTSDEEKEKLYLKEYNAMMENHEDHETETEDLDRAFAQGMSMHHQMAVDMARLILAYTEDDEVKQFADNVISLQEEEITQMQSYLQESGGGNHAH